MQDFDCRRFARVGLAVAVAFLVCLPARAAEVQHLTITEPGGMPGWPVVTGINAASNIFSITWDGPAGYYRLMQKTNLTDQSWKQVGGLNLSRIATVTNTSKSAFFSVVGPSPQYAGAQACAECHESIHTSEMNTRHAHAFETLVSAHSAQNASCLPCHTVGFGLPTGFKNISTTPNLAGVQCENCHGPAAAHAANPEDPSLRPRADIASQVCGGCHTDSHHPTFNEWDQTGHAVVVEDMSPASRINSCGRCHSGSARLVLLAGGNPQTVTNDANVAITCVVCHDPHAQHVWTNKFNGVMTNLITGYTITNNQLGAVYTNQVRNPLASSTRYSLATSAVFTNAYDASINICGQCHNDRGARWQDGSRPPHHSLQYSMLIGAIGELPSGPSTNRPSSHALMEKQCVVCHMQTSDYVAGPPEQNAKTGHSFAADSYQACTQCHGSNTNSIAGFVDLIQGIVISGEDFSIDTVKALLDQWALTKAPPEIQKYGTLAWEYQNAGELSSPDGALKGPVSSSDPAKDEQKYIPDNIKKARFNLYLVDYDGSFGVHNGPQALLLLQTARDLVLKELLAP